MSGMNFALVSSACARSTIDGPGPVEPKVGSATIHDCETSNDSSTTTT
jgi:hypothetical protein